MVYLTIFGYMYGNTNRIFRGIDKNGNVCGLPGGVAENYPYLWFHSPTATSNFQNKVCVDVCPGFPAGSTTLSQPNCYGGSCTFTHTYDSSGTITPATTPTDADYVGYDSTALLGRACLPSSTVFTTAFATLQSAFASAMSQKDLASIISDIKTVISSLIFRIGNISWQPLDSLLLSASSSCML